MSSPMHDEESAGSSSAASASAGASASSASSARSRPALSEFGKAFASKLEQLKGTDKQSITSLTILADEHRDRADEVVELLKRRMQQLPSGDYRLPLMYLIDSICQNLGKKGAEYPRKLQPHIKPMLHHMLKHCSASVKGSLFRMWAAWKRGHTFNAAALADIETMFDSFMSKEEREEAIARRSTATGAAPAPEDPRKRSHAAAGTPSPSASPSYGTESSAAASAPHAKKAMLHDPRRPPAAPAAAPMIPEAAQFSMILESPDIAGRVELRGVVASMQKQLRRALPVEEMKAVVAQLVIQLQQALAVAPPPQPQPQPTAALPMPLPPLQPPPPTFNPYAAAPPMPLPLPLPPQSPAQAWVPVPLPSSYRNAQPPPPRVEAARPITLSEEDLKTKHPWLANSLYSSIPLVCKSCGRRIHNSTEMGSHLDWHVQMSKRAAHIAKSQSGSRWQNWYWDQDEWIMSTDVIFGVQNRATVAAMAAKSKSASAAAAAAAAKGYTPASLVSDDGQPSCAMCATEFKKEWSDEDENWMFRDVLRLGADDVAKARADIERIEKDKPAPAPAAVPEMDEEARALATVASGGVLPPAPATVPAAAVAVNSTQTAALASKESDRQLSLWRAHKVLKHALMFAGRIVHQACHYGVMANIAKMVRTKDEEGENAAAASEGEQGRRDGASPAPGAAAAAKLESSKPEPLKMEPKLEPLPALE